MGEVHTGIFSIYSDFTGKINIPLIFCDSMYSIQMLFHVVQIKLNSQCLHIMRYK